MRDGELKNRIKSGRETASEKMKKEARIYSNKECKDEPTCRRRTEGRPEGRQEQATKTITQERKG